MLGRGALPPLSADCWSFNGADPDRNRWHLQFRALLEWKWRTLAVNEEACHQRLGPSLSISSVTNYFQRSHHYGEIENLLWLQRLSWGHSKRDLSRSNECNDCEHVSVSTPLPSLLVNVVVCCSDVCTPIVVLFALRISFV